MVDTNGVLVTPTNFFATNAALLNAAVTASGGTTNLASSTNNGLMSSNQVAALATAQTGSTALTNLNAGNGAALTNLNSRAPNEAWVETTGSDSAAATFVAQNGGGSPSAPFLTIQAAVKALAFPTNSGGVIHIGFGRFAAPGAFILTNLTVTQSGSPSPAVAGNYVLGGDTNYPADYYGTSGGSNYYITAVAGSYWKLQNDARTAFYQASQPLFGTWYATNSATGAITVAASASDPLFNAYRGWHLVGRQRPNIQNFTNASIIVGSVAFDMNNCSVEDLGIDVSASAMNGVAFLNSQHSSESVTYQGNGMGNPSKTGCYVRNVSALGHGSTDAVHAVLLENLTGAYGDYIWTYNTGIGVAFKCLNSSLSHLNCDTHTTAALWIRDEDYAPLDNFTVDNVLITSGSGMVGIIMGTGPGTSGTANLGTIYACVRTAGIGLNYSLPAPYQKGTISNIASTTNSVGTLPTYLIINN